MDSISGAEIFRRDLVKPTDLTIVAYDAMNWIQIEDTASEVGPFTGIGKTNSAHVRPGADYSVDTLARHNQLAMLDYKFHDIPQTVELSVKEATLAGGSLITVHAGGGFKMLEAAVKGAEAAREELALDPTNLENLSKLGHVLGITVLTSLKEESYSIFGLDPDDTKAIEKKVIEFARMALDAGLTGIVCSPEETRALREDSDFDNLLVVNPGITPIFAKQAKDQKRTTSAVEAVKNGADLVVVGRGINQAADYKLTKSEAAIKIGEENQQGLEERMAA